MTSPLLSYACETFTGMNILLRLEETNLPVSIQGFFTRKRKVMGPFHSDLKGEGSRRCYNQLRPGALLVVAWLTPKRRRLRHPI